MAPSVARMPQLMSPPSKAGPRRAGAAHHKVRVTEYELAVGSQINEQREFRSVPDHTHQGARGNIAAYIASDVGRDNDMRVLVDIDSHI